MSEELQLDQNAPGHLKQAHEKDISAVSATSDRLQSFDAILQSEVSRQTYEVSYCYYCDRDNGFLIQPHNSYPSPAQCSICIIIPGSC